jgi:hypothetical protein
MHDGLPCRISQIMRKLGEETENEVAASQASERYLEKCGVLEQESMYMGERGGRVFC